MVENNPKRKAWLKKNVRHKDILALEKRASKDEVWDGYGNGGLVGDLRNLKEMLRRSWKNDDPRLLEKFPPEFLVFLRRVDLLVEETATVEKPAPITKEDGEIKLKEEEINQLRSERERLWNLIKGLKPNQLNYSERDEVLKVHRYIYNLDNLIKQKEEELEAFKKKEPAWVIIGSIFLTLIGFGGVIYFVAHEPAFRPLLRLGGRVLLVVIFVPIATILAFGMLFAFGKPEIKKKDKKI